MRATKGDAAAWLLGGRDHEEGVDTIKAPTALRLLQVVMPPGVSCVRAGYWVGVKTNAASSLTRPLRAPGGEFRDDLQTTPVWGFPLTMVDLEADPAHLVDTLRVPLPGLEDTLEWPEYLHLRETGTRLWLSPGNTRALVVAPAETLDELTQMPSLAIHPCEDDVTDLIADLTRHP